ncbi:unnamed protein product, partial [marine sediment metagenome]
ESSVGPLLDYLSTVDYTPVIPVGAPTAADWALRPWAGPPIQ